MKKYLLKISIFLIPLILGFLLLISYASRNHHFHASTWYYYKDFEYAFHEKDIDILALGNSKLLSALDKTVMEDTLKKSVALLGYSSANISISKLTLEAYLQNSSKKPSLVLLEVSWFTFNNERTHLHNIAGDLFIKDPSLFVHILKYDDDLLVDIKKSFKMSLQQFSETESSKNDISYAIKFKAKSPLTVDYTFNISDMEVVFPDHIAGVDPFLFEEFNALVEICKSNHINLILFTAPEDETFSKSQKDIKDIKSIFHNLSDKNQNISYLDYSFGGDLWDKKYEMWLKDSHHINENELFTLELLKDIEQ